MKNEWESRDWADTRPEDRRPQLSPFECSLIDAVRANYSVSVMPNPAFASPGDVRFSHSGDSPSSTAPNSSPSDTRESVVREPGRASMADQVAFLGGGR